MSFEIYDIYGRFIEKLDEDDFSPGIYQYNWNCSNCPSGVYLLRIGTGKFLISRKLILLK